MTEVTNLWLEGSGVSLQTLLDCFLPLLLVIKVVVAVVAVAIEAKFAIGEAITVSKISNRI